MRMSLKSLCALSLLALALPHGGHASPAVIAEDAYTSSALAKVKLGAKTSLSVGTKETSFLRFDLSALPAGFPSDQVAKATLRLWLTKPVRPGSVKVVTVDGAWTEAALTNATAPATGASMPATFNLQAGQKKIYVSVDVTALVKEWVSGQRTNFGLAL